MTSVGDAVISVRGLGKRYRIWTHSRPRSFSDRVAISLRRGESRPVREDVWALRDVSFEVGAGEVLGVIGPNGAGKSTLLSLLAQITDPTEGVAELRGRVSSLLEVGTGFHPELSGRDNVFLNGAILGMSRAETATKFDEIVEFSGVGEFIDMPVKRYSTGMYVRLAFSVAAHLDPEILLLDEVFAVGDRAFQEKCLERITEMTRSGRTVLFVSHDVSSVARLCNKAIVLNGGRLVFGGNVDDAIEQYLASRPIGGGRSADEERDATHAARIGHVEVVPADADVVRADRPLAIRIRLHAPESLRADALRLQIGIHANLGAEYVTLATDFDPSRPLDGVDVGDDPTIACHVDELPLKPGTYTVSATLQLPGGEVVDRVENQAPFAIVPSDFYGSGVLPGEHHLAPVLVRHRWEVTTTPSLPATRSPQAPSARR